MAHTQMLEAYPRDLGGIDKSKLAECIAACIECGQVCATCVYACLSEDMVAELTKCIRTNLNCADMCIATGNALSRHTGYDANLTKAFLKACATACKTCGDECSEHGQRMSTAGSVKRLAADAKRHAERSSRLSDAWIRPAGERTTRMPSDDSTQDDRQVGRAENVEARRHGARALDVPADARHHAEHDVPQAGQQPGRRRASHSALLRCIRRDPRRWWTTRPTCAA